MTAPAPMTEAQFILFSEIYGGDLAAWPVEARAAAAQLAVQSPAAQAALEEAAFLDDLLRADVQEAAQEPASEALTARILIDADHETNMRLETLEALAAPPPASWRRRLRRSNRPRRPAGTGLAATALAGAMAAGLVLGFFAPQWAQSVAPFALTQTAEAEIADPYGYDAYDGMMSAAEGWMDG